MSAWRIDKIDAQTRALAEAASRAAGLPLGVWLERAIMRRVSGKQTVPPPVPPLPAEEAEAPGNAAAEEISPEMQAALDAAERRRRERTGDTSSPPQEIPADIPEKIEADPFATPEKTVEDAPFEAAVAETSPGAEIPAIVEDEPVIDGAPDGKDSSIDDGAEEVLPPLEKAESPLDTKQTKTGYLPSWETDTAEVTTTTRESLVPSAPSPGTTPTRRTPSALPVLLGGIVVIAAAAAGAYYFLAGDGGQKPAQITAQVAPTVPAEKPAQTPPAPPTVTAPPAAPTPANEPAAAPAPANEPAAAPPAVADPVPSPRPAGPSIANLAQPDPGAVASAVTPAPPPAEVAPSPATAPADPSPKPPIASETLPALRKRAEAGNIDAQIELGRRYVQGVGVGRNEAEAAKWLLRAAEQGDAQAQFNIGVMYERGVGVATDLPKAMDFYRKSAAQRTPMALHNLALIYAGGAPGVKADPPQALKLMTQASELGQMESQYSLSLMYLQGVGTKVDRAEAMSWLAVAARPSQPQLVEAAKQLSAQINDADRKRAQQLYEGHIRRIEANLRNAPQPAAAASTASATAPPRVVDRAAIVEIQKLLSALKIYNGKADGTVGSRTAAAIRDFQTMAGLPEDGKPSIALLESLREITNLSKQ